MRKLIAVVSLIVLAFTLSAFQIPLGSTWQGATAGPAYLTSCANDNNSGTTVTCPASGSISVTAGEIVQGAVLFYNGTMPTFSAVTTSNGASDTITYYSYNGSTTNANTNSGACTVKSGAASVCLFQIVIGTTNASWTYTATVSSTAYVTTESIFASGGSSSSPDGSPCMVVNYTGGTVNTCQITTAHNGDLITAFITDISGVGFTVSAGSCCALAGNNVTNGFNIYGEYGTQASSGAITPTFVIGTGPYNHTDGVMAVRHP